MFRQERKFLKGEMEVVREAMNASNDTYWEYKIVSELASSKSPKENYERVL